MEEWQRLWEIQLETTESYSSFVCFGGQEKCDLAGLRYSRGYEDTPAGMNWNMNDSWVK
jgi:hypothetical protein